MSALETFLWGLVGSVAVEIVALLGYYYSDVDRLPRRYKKIGFWITRALLALLAGALAVGYDIEQRILAFNIGAATPLIITFLARGFRPTGPTATDSLAMIERKRGHRHEAPERHAPRHLTRSSHGRDPSSDSR